MRHASGTHTSVTRVLRGGLRGVDEIAVEAEDGDVVVDAGAWGEGQPLGPDQLVDAGMGLAELRVRPLDASEDDLLLRQLVHLEGRLRGGAGRHGPPDRQGRVGLAVLGVVLEDAARADGCQTLAPELGHEPLPQPALLVVGGDGAAQGDDGAGGDGRTGDDDGGHGSAFLVEELVDECQPLLGRAQLVAEGLPLQGECLPVALGAVGGEEDRDGGNREAHVAEPPHVGGLGELLGRVAAVAGDRVHVGGHEDPVLAVVAQHPHAETRPVGELADRHEVRGVGHGPTLSPHTV